jgi:uncharacterized protein (DUF305 family)
VVVALATLAAVGGIAPASAQTARTGRSPYTEADVHFMAGMIAHHAQAVLMAGWAPSHEASTTIRNLCEKIIVSQRDEIAFMQRWLRERGETVPPEDPSGLRMPGMDHAMPMPGMLTPEQLTRLDAARGPEFDALFLQFMIQHHRGAITMVEELLAAQGVGDGQVFRFASDVTADQGTEIDRMSRMLATMPSQNQPR